jgi:hypothetical protein
VVPGRHRTLHTVGETVLTDTCQSRLQNEVHFPFIVGDRNTPINRREGYDVVGANALCPGHFGFWHYPAGGKPYKLLASAPANPSGWSVSIAP